MADSVIFALFEENHERTVKILYTPKFYPGSYKQLELIEDDLQQREMFFRVAQVAEHSVLEKSHDIHELFC